MRTSSSVVALTPRVYMRSAAARTIRSRVAKPRLVRRRACVSSYAARDMAATLGQGIPLAIHSGPSSPIIATDGKGADAIGRPFRRTGRTQNADSSGDPHRPPPGTVGPVAPAYTRDGPVS